MPAELRQSCTRPSDASGASSNLHQQAHSGSASRKGMDRLAVDAGYLRDVKEYVYAYISAKEFYVEELHNDAVHALEVNASSCPSCYADEHDNGLLRRARQQHSAGNANGAGHDLVEVFIRHFIMRCAALRPAFDEVHAGTKQLEARKAQPVPRDRHCQCDGCMQLAEQLDAERRCRCHNELL